MRPASRGRLWLASSDPQQRPLTWRLRRTCSTARSAVRTGASSTCNLRPVQQQEWTLGDDVLVAPVVSEGASSCEVYFPAGCWRDPQTGLTKRGPVTARFAAPLTTLPYFFRCGTRPFPTTTAG
jgi:hypothetical protein